MNKLNMRHWSERMAPAGFGMGRPNMHLATQMPHPKPQHPAQMPPSAQDSTIHYSFNVPFASDLPGPNTEDIVYGTSDAVLRWTHPESAPDDVHIYELPVHQQNVMQLRALCKDITNSPLPIEAYVKSSEPKRVKGQVVNVCLSGLPELVHKTRERILNETPLALRCAVVDIDVNLAIDMQDGDIKVKAHVVHYLDEVAAFCGVDIFFLGPKPSTAASSSNDSLEVGEDRRFRFAIYGDMASAEHAKTRILIFIDRLLGRAVDAMRLELSLHTVLCGRARKHIKLIEAATNTAIYFPTPFAKTFRYVPPGANARNPDEILITGESEHNIHMAKQKIHDFVTPLRLFAKPTVVTPPKLDSILLGRLDKIRKIMETNGTFIQFPQLGSQLNVLRIQGLEGLHVERSIRDVMALTSQFYTASWQITHPDGMRPSPADIRTMLSDVCANSDAEVCFDKLTFTLTGSDDSVKLALMVLSDIRFLTRTGYTIRVKLELANEHKEFVSGKKNGKINKIMGQSSVQIIFDGFNEYDFNIDVCSTNYECLKNGLSLVEQEMPASISFHVPDQYHKRIIGIGGQHIQRIMKKHSVFVKFSNAIERGSIGREDDDLKVDNVVCRTPARNAQSLELVKSEILELVDRADSEFTTQTVPVDRLYHRQLLIRLPDLESMEKKWNCKIIFPSTEQATDDITVSGPEWQVPQCVDEFLGMVPSNHELQLLSSPELIAYFESQDFKKDFVPKLKAQNFDVQVKKDVGIKAEGGESTITLLWTFTRNNQGGVSDAIESLISELASKNIDTSIVKGAPSRPKSDTFEDTYKFFNSKLLQHAPAPISTDSPIKTSFGNDAARERTTLLDKIRKPGSMGSITSFLDRRKNSSHSPAGSVFKNGSGNVSKSSLISIESTRSFNADRNPWNDSGVNLSDDNSAPWPNRPFGNGSFSEHKLSFTPIHPGDVTPKHSMRGSTDSGRPSTSHSTNSGYPGPIGPPRLT